MQYKSDIYNLALYKKNGTIAYQFKNGKLAVGSLSCGTGTGNYIVATPQSPDTNTLQPLGGQFALDLAGATTQSVEMCGQGSLNSVDNGGSVISTFNLGKRGLFHPAPRLVGTTAVSSYANIWYEVEDGTVTYNGVTYSTGQKFRTVQGVTTTTGTGHFSLAIPPTEAELTKEAFKITLMQTGDEASDYWLKTDGGFSPRNTNGSTGLGYVTE